VNCKSFKTKSSQGERNCDSAKSKARADFFRQVGNRIIESNHLGQEIKFTPDTSRIQPERITLANLEFKNRDADKVGDEDLIEDRILSLELRLELHRLHMPSGLKAHIRFNETTSKVASCKESEEIKHTQILQCPVCLGRTELLLPEARAFHYARKDALQRHFKTHKLPMFFDKPGRPCDIPGCIHFSVSLPGYQFHLAKRHSIFL
jgi:hypothetical protein